MDYHITMAAGLKGAAPPLGDGIEFQVLDWYIPEADKAARELGKPLGSPVAGDADSEGPPAAPVYNIYMYGATASGHSVCAKVTGFEPYFYVAPPENWRENITSHVNQLRMTLDNDWKVIPKALRDHLVSMRVIYKKDFWGFTNGREFPFIRVKVKSLGLFYKLRKYFDNKKGFKLYESNIDPFLRFIHERNISPCGWVSIDADDYTLIEGDDTRTRCDYEIHVPYKRVYPMDRNLIAPILIASFDIECTSSHGDFPVARKDYRKLALDLIEACSQMTVFWTIRDIYDWIMRAYQETHTTRDGVVINRLYPKKRILPDSDREKDLEIKVREILVDIETYIRYAIEAKKKRSRKAGPAAADAAEDGEDGEADEDAPAPPTNAEIALVNLLTKHLPALKGDPIIQIGTTVHRYGSNEIIYRHIGTLKSCDLIEGAEVESFETEEQLIMGWKDMITRLDPDIITGYNIFGFDFKYIWNRAREIGCANEFVIGLGRLKERETTLLEQKLSSSALGDNVLYYFDLDGVVTIDMYKVMTRDHKLDSYKLDNVAEIFLGENKNDITPNQIFAKYYGTASDRCEIARYCLQDCRLVNLLMDKLKVLENNVGMGNVCSVPLSYLFMRGQGVKIFSLVAKECRLKKHLIPTLARPTEVDDADAVGYEGAIVLDPKEGIYTDHPITVLDYSSLYPSSMISRDLSHDRYVDPDGPYTNIPGVEYKTISFDLYSGVGDKKVKTGESHCTFAQAPGGEKGIIPAILQKLLLQRKNTRKKIEYETIILADGTEITGLPTGENMLMNIDTGEKINYDPAQVKSRRDTYNEFEKAVLDALQLAYKVTANSLYGQVGSRTSPIYLKEIAACTTATGREMIMLAKNFVETRYGAEVIYGDTDSIFCKFPVTDAEGRPLIGKEAVAPAIAAGQRTEREIKSVLPNHQSLAFEKVLYPVILLTKKRYVGLLYENDANAKPKLKSQGIVLKRRDNAPIVKKIYGGILDIILNKYNVPESIDFLFDQLKNLVDGNVPLEDLIISKTLKSTYKDPSKIAHKVLADRMGVRDEGTRPMVNDRIPYVYIKTPGDTPPALQGDRIEHPNYIRENNITPDYMFYITNQIMKPVSQLYTLCVEDLPGYDYPPDHWNSQMKLLEQSESTMYNTEKKRKNKIMNMKLRVVEHLLFNQSISALGGKTKRIMTISSIQSPKKSPKPKYESEIGAEAPSLILNVIENKEEKIYNTSAKFESAAPCGLENIELIIPRTAARGRGGVMSKEAAYRKIAEKAFSTAAENDTVIENGLRVFITKLPVFVNGWNSELIKYNNPQEDEAGPSHDPTDIGAISEIINKNILYGTLLNYSKVFTYTVSATPKK